jgi:hypothetical protein
MAPRKQGSADGPTATLDEPRSDFRRPKGPHLKAIFSRKRAIVVGRTVISAIDVLPVALIFATGFAS